MRSIGERSLASGARLSCAVQIVKGLQDPRRGPVEIEFPDLAPGARRKPLPFFGVLEEIDDRPDPGLDIERQDVTVLPSRTSSPAAAVISVVTTGLPANIASLMTTPQQSPEVGSSSSFDWA